MISRTFLLAHHVLTASSKSSKALCEALSDELVMGQLISFVFYWFTFPCLLFYFSTVVFYFLLSDELVMRQLISFDSNGLLSPVYFSAFYFLLSEELVVDQFRINH